MDWNDRAWIKAAGYSRRRNVGSLFLIVVASPFLWYWFHREFYSTRFRWATFMLITGTAVTTAWMELGMRCRCCTIPVLVYRFLESPSDRRKHALFDPTRCPYCGDDNQEERPDIAATAVASGFDPCAIVPVHR